jgi:hypothetical protein
MTRPIKTGAKFGLREQVIAEGRAYGTSSREGSLPPGIFADGLKMMISRWRCAGIEGNWATAGEQAAQAAYRSKDVMIAGPPVPSSPASTPAPLSAAEGAHRSWGFQDLRDLSQSIWRPFAATSISPSHPRGLCSACPGGGMHRQGQGPAPYEFDRKISVETPMGSSLMPRRCTAVFFDGHPLAERDSWVGMPMTVVGDDSPCLWLAPLCR